jgi:hypothetical protein
MRSDIPATAIAKTLQHATRLGGGVPHSSVDKGPTNAEDNVRPVRVSDRSNLVPPDLLDKEEGKPGPAVSPGCGTAEPVQCSVSLLFNEAAKLRPRYAAAEDQHDKIASDLLTIAFRMAVIAIKDELATAAMRDEAKRLGARPNRRSGIEHLVVDGTFGPKTSLRTRHAQAVRAGIALGLTPEQFAEAAAKGRSGKGGIKELARTGRSLVRQKKAANGSAPASTSSSPNPNPEAHLTVDRRVPLRDQGFLYALLTTEEVRQSLLASDLKTGDEFSLLVRITRSNGLEGVRYLGPRMPAPDGPAAG